jgi:hypothetical protein
MVPVPLQYHINIINPKGKEDVRSSIYPKTFLAYT